MIHRLIIGAVAAFLTASPASAQSPASKDLPARVEVYSFPTLTISDTQSGIPQIEGRLVRS